MNVTPPTTPNSLLTYDVRLLKFGLGFMPSINLGERPIHMEPKDEDKVYGMARQYGCGRPDMKDIPWLCCFLLMSTASVMDISLAVYVHAEDCNIDGNIVARICGAALNFALSHGVLILGSVVVSQS